MRETITTTSGDTTTTQVLDFIYESGSTPLALVYTNGTASPVTYYYVTNMQGDVVKLVRANGTTVASYAYDAWGKVLSATGSMADVNPIRYRGYHYDAETELYYLQSRYYDSAVKRFVNADGVTTTGQGFLGCNMFAYCNNNPVSRVDYSGYDSCSHDNLHANELPIVFLGGGLNLPEGAGTLVEVAGELYYYWSTYYKGQLYEYWYNMNRELVWGRHHSDHSTPWYHSNPHDHIGAKDKKGNNTIVGGPQPVNSDFKSHVESNLGNNNFTSDNATNDALVVILVGVAAYEVAKWGVAVFLTPLTGGASLAVAGAMP
ncbi:MAG: RHS repeat-associated core domain-containing protein [Ruminococcaceae bacterium]|nr:RHS repeat-associated core domain-containing protein [Oscillospiraceae bacterium]